MNIIIKNDFNHKLNHILFFQKHEKNIRMNNFTTFVKQKTIIMKKIIYVLLLTLTVTIYSCKKKSGCNDSTALNFDSSAQLNDGSCTYGPDVLTGNGNVIFYKSPLSGFDTINIQIGGDVKQIKVAFSFLPTCGQSGCANYNLSPGTYSFTADEIHGALHHWSGTVTINPQECSTHWIN